MSFVLNEVSASVLGQFWVVLEGELKVVPGLSWMSGTQACAGCGRAWLRLAAGLG